MAYKEDKLPPWHESMRVDCLPPLKRRYVGCFGTALKKAAFELLGKLGSTFVCRIEVVQDKIVRQRKPNWRHIVKAKARQCFPYYFD